jgi:TPR repeat protein
MGQGHAQALYCLGVLTMNGEAGLTKDHKKAADLLQEAADKGSEKAADVLKECKMHMELEETTRQHCTEVEQAFDEEGKKISPEDFHNLTRAIMEIDFAGDTSLLLTTPRTP